MNFMKRFVSGLGAQAAPFGFGLDNPDTQYRAGLSFIGDVGANMLANNQGGRDPWTNLGMSMQEAKAGSLVRNRQSMAAQQMMQEAEDNRRKREEEAAAKKQREDWISSLSPDLQALARIAPDRVAGALVKEQFPNQQTGGGLGMTPLPLTDGKGNWTVGQLSPEGGVMVDGKPAGAEWKYDPYGLNSAKAGGTLAGDAPRYVVKQYTEKVRPAMDQTSEALMAVDQAETLLENVQTGSGAEISQAIRGWGATIGIPVDETVLADTQTYQNFISNVVIPRMQALGGNDSNEELRYLKSTMGGDITQSKTALKATLALTRKLLNKRMEQYKAYEEVALPYLGLPPVPEFDPLTGGAPNAVTTDDGYKIEQVGE